MSKYLVTGLAFAVLCTNVLWWYRTRTLKGSLTTSRTRDKRVAARTNAHSANDPALHVAAERADCPPEELPAQIETLRDRIRDCERELSRVRQLWAHSWRKALQRSPVDLDTPHLLVVHLDDATVEDIQYFADHAESYPDEVAIVTTTDSFAVSVGDHLTDFTSAAKIADRILEQTDGAGGGSATFATGGGIDPERLDPAVDRVASQIETQITQDHSVE